MKPHKLEKPVGIKLIPAVDDKHGYYKLNDCLNGLVSNHLKSLGAKLSVELS